MGNFGKTRGGVGKSGVLEHKSAAISEMRKDLMKSYYVGQGCSLGLDVSVSRRSRDAFSQRLGLVSVSEKCGNVSVSVSD